MVRGWWHEAYACADGEPRRSKGGLGDKIVACFLFSTSFFSCFAFCLEMTKGAQIVGHT